MKKKISLYINEVDNLLKNKKVDNIEEVLENHLIKISFYQHERLIHLIVTALFSLLFIITFLYTINSITIGNVLLSFMFLLLLIPYIFHYYFLENSVQKLYLQYDFLNLKTKNNS